MTPGPDDAAPAQEGEAGGVSGLTQEHINSIVEALANNDAATAKALAEPLHYADLADLIESLDADNRAKLVDLMRDSFDPVVLTELDETVREQVIERLGMPQIAEAVAEMDSDDQLFVLGELEPHERDEVLASLPADERSQIREGLAYPEHSAGRLMQREFVAMPETWTVGEAIDHMRDSEDLPSDFYDVILVDADHHPVGAVPLSRILAARRPTSLASLAIRDTKTIPVDTDQEDVAFLFRQRDLISAPVVDANSRLVGVITIDDIVDVIDEEHEEDIKLLAGVSEDDTLFSAVLGTVRLRATWLSIYLLAAALAASVVHMFQGTIEQMVALAVLMPVVAAMGGTASVQALTVAVRAIAMKELTPANALRNVGKEIVVGLLNGILFALVIGTATWVFFDSVTLSLVIGLAIIFNLIIAGLYGSIAPLLVQRLGLDPAVASSAFATAITDIAGFFVFLGLAAVLLFQ